MKFIEFVNDQVSRLEAVPGFQMGDAGRKEIVAWLAEKAFPWPIGAKAVRDGSAAWARDFEPGSHIKAVIDECVEFSTPPGLSDIKAVWYRLYPPVSSHERCEHCNGTGYRIVKRGGVEGAARCSG